LVWDAAAVFLVDCNREMDKETCSNNEENCSKEMIHFILKHPAVGFPITIQQIITYTWVI